MRRLAERTVAFAVAGVVVTGCASMSAAGHEVPSADPPAQVLVHNDGQSDVDVYAYRGDQRVRMGEVVAHGSQLLTLPRGMARPGHVRLLLHQVGGGDYVPDEVPIRPGEEHADLRVARVLDETAITVVPGRMH